MASAVMPMEPLRTEHRELLPHIENLAQCARDAAHAPPGVVRRDVETALEFLRHHLVPHAMAEDEVLYPAVERLMGAPGATAIMRRDHVEVGRLIEALGEAQRELQTALDVELRDRLARLLYSLHAIVRLHFAEEEEIYVPLLDERLSVAEGAELLEEMERAAATHRAH